MAAASTSTSVRNKGKTEFVQEVLRKNPKANTTAVNEAWTEAGREGAISTRSLTSSGRRWDSRATSAHRTNPGPARHQVQPRPALEQRPVASKVPRLWRPPCMARHRAMARIWLMPRLPSDRPKRQTGLGCSKSSKPISIACSSK